MVVTCLIWLISIHCLTYYTGECQTIQELVSLRAEIYEQSFQPSVECLSYCFTGSFNTVTCVTGFVAEDCDTCQIYRVKESPVIENAEYLGDDKSPCGGDAYAGDDGRIECDLGKEFYESIPDGEFYASLICYTQPDPLTTPSTPPVITTTPPQLSPGVSNGSASITASEGVRTDVVGTSSSPSTSSVKSISTEANIPVISSTASESVVEKSVGKSFTTKEAVTSIVSSITPSPSEIQNVPLTSTKSASTATSTGIPAITSVLSVYPSRLGESEVCSPCQLQTASIQQTITQNITVTTEITEYVTLTETIATTQTRPVPLDPISTEAFINSIVEKMTINKTSTASYKMKYVSATDERTSATSMGVVAIVLLAGLFVFLGLMDMQHIFSDFRTMKQNILSAVRKPTDEPAD